MPMPWAVCWGEVPAVPGPESVRGYLDAVEAQIRWKRARTVAARELETHLEEQQEEFLAEGHPPEEAERLAVEDMGDPVAVGADLDRLHRPRPQWGMLGLTLALLLVGGWLRYALTRAGAPWDEDLDPLRCALSVVTGAAVLVGAYFLDVSRLLRWAKWVYISALIVGVLFLRFSPIVNNVSYFTRYVVLFYPAVYALWLYACRGKGWRGLLAAVICCVEGNAGAPLEMDEVDTLEEEYPNYKPYMTPEGIRAVEAQGFMVVDEDGDYTTPLVDDAECAYAYTEEGITFCAIEKAFREGKTTFRKPISCHLYPIRLMNFSNGTVGLNYHRWSICEPARQCGKRLGIPVYKALREPIIRRFGEEFYKALETAEQLLKNQ